MAIGVNYDYSGSKVLVTGGSNGIGLACARQYQQAGAQVTITGRKPSVSDYPHDLSGLQYRQYDVADQAQTEALAASLSGLDILVANAGGSSGDEWSTEGFNHALTVNLASVFHLASACKPLLAASTLSGGASIIGIASMTSYFGFAFTPGYGPAKAGLVQLIKTLAVSWAADNIRANAVAAGLTHTNLTGGFIDTMPEAVAPTLARQALKRVGSGDDIAAAVLFLSSPQASWITGQTLPVDGGFTIQMS